MTTKYSTVCITKNIVFIKENIASVDRILDLLLEDDVLQMSEREDIVCKTPGERVHTMIDMVLKRRAQQVFIDALRRTGQNLIVEKILGTQREVSGQIKEPKPHTMSLLSPKIAAYAPFHRERTTSWQLKEHFAGRKSNDEVYKRHIDNLLEAKRLNEAKIRHLENEMEKVRKTEQKKYKQLEKEHRELTKENNHLKSKVDDLNIKLAAREEMLKKATSKIESGQDEVDSPMQSADKHAFHDLKKSQENFENKLMKEMTKNQQQLMKIVENLSQKSVMQERKIAEATAKLETATSKLEAAADKIDSRMDNENRKSGKHSVHSNGTMLPPLNPGVNKLGNTFLEAREKSFFDGVGVPQKK